MLAPFDFFYNMLKIIFSKYNCVQHKNILAVDDMILYQKTPKESTQSTSKTPQEALLHFIGTKTEALRGEVMVPE